ncbi:BTAD domain-containing putative transcriptional regulator [Geodermatophilus sabuli]|uniref:Transcriptional regulatory protein, C terminal n=1 Tax=Geodermatophilus sabuli TaxID=1564158 RepID=A0A285EIM0_9ACTN|nr:BTAD domain-containing putative transcriptional regulator [Geodermatophilus sabuli]MBB3086765.1 DNA-binding SARP family transcriptional activator [Geodermatophilus sabuli]SNX98860.1 Transcriptional regulatory protein, C terminal [Geodermatophilus sabuli]
MRYRVLGPLEVTGPDGRPLDVGGAKPRALLTLLLAEAGRGVAIDRIVATLWGDDPPPTVTGTLQAYVSHLRRVLEPGRGPRQAPKVLLTRPPGYLLQADAAELDSLRFTQLVDEGDRAVDGGDPARGVALLDQALKLWRGQPLAELGDQPAAATDRLRLTELHVRARERRCDALLAMGRADSAVPDLEHLVAEHPLRERLWARLVTALYAADRQAEALDALRRCTELLRDELGIDPGPELRDLERAVLRQDPTLTDRLPRPVLSIVPPPAPMPSVTPGSESLVGRQAEMAHLRAVSEQATAGRPGIVVLGGEAGIGKTRLAEAAADAGRAAGWSVAWSRCADDAGAPPLWPWTQVLEQLGQEPLPPLPDDTGADADAARFGLFQDLRARLAAAAGRPVLVVLDDLQGADTTSVQLLGLLARHLPRVPLMLIVTARTIGEDLPPAVVDCLARLNREPAVSRIRLAGLSTEDVGVLMAGQLGAVGGRSLAGTVHDRTAGNPFFVVELARWMVGAHDLHLDGVPVPPSVGEVLRHRLERLPAGTREVLELAAVAGREVGLDLLEAAGTPAEDALAALDSATAYGLVVEGGRPWSWRFTHALVQEVLYADLPRLRRARLHARLAAALERPATGRADDALVERLAHHFVEAVPVAGPGPALRYSTAAAQAARRRLAHGEAAAHVRRALSLLDPAAADAARTRHDLLTALGNDLLRSGEPTEARDVVADAIAVAQELDDRRCLLESAAVWGSPTLWNWRPHGVVDHEMVALLEDLLDDREERGGWVADTAGPEEQARLTARLLGTLGVELAFSEDLQKGPRYAERAVALAREVGDPELLGRTLNNHSLAVWGRPGAAELRLAATDEALALAGRGLPRRTEFYARLHRAAIRLHLADLRGFEADMDAGRRLSISLSGPEVRPHVLWQQAGAAWLGGDAARAEELTTEAYELYRRVTPHALHAYAAHQFTLRRGDHRLPEAVDLLVRTGDEGNPVLQLMAVLAAAESGDLATARRLRKRWGRTHVRDWASDVATLLEAEVALQIGDVPEIEMATVQVLPFRGRQAVLGTPSFSLGAYDELLGRIAERTGDTVAAREWWRAARRQGVAVGSPHQVALADSHLARVPEETATRPRRRRSSAPRSA